MNYILAFFIGGLFCIVGQIIMDKTKLTPARIMVGYVVAGVILGGTGLFSYIADFAGAGATVPLVGFGNSLANGVKEAVNNKGFAGVFTGGLTMTAGGICAAILFGYLCSLFFKPKTK